MDHCKNVAAAKAVRHLAATTRQALLERPGGWKGRSAKSEQVRDQVTGRMARTLRRMACACGKRNFMFTLSCRTAGTQRQRGAFGCNKSFEAQPPARAEPRGTIGKDERRVIILQEAVRREPAAGERDHDTGHRVVRITVFCSAIVIDVIFHCHTAGAF